MEMASYLAGERWTDQPKCTHPLLAELAREVNDHVADDNRQRLVPLVPSVIGMTSDDPHVDVGIALLAASTALPVAPEPAQRALAVAVLTCTQVLATLDGADSGRAAEDGRAVLLSVPRASSWARRFTEGSNPTVPAFRRYAAPHTVRVAVRGIAKAMISEPDLMLCDLLEEAVLRFPDWAGWATTPSLDTVQQPLPV
jgi:hypothetical protein